MLENKTYNFDWNDSVTLECGSQLSSDKLNRATYAKFLTNFLVGEASRGYVLNLNSGWGTGKTYFLERWRESIREQHPTVYINAWKQDFSNDPMLAVVSSIISQLRDQSQEEAEQRIREVGSKIWGFCKQAAPEVTKAVVKKISGVDVEKVINDSEEDNLFEGKEFADATGKLVAAVFKDHDAKLKSIDDFKEAINAFIDDTISCSGKQNPTFIFIDELDRCRPSYAVEMLEVIKHFFDMPNVIFVVATDTEQLQHAVKAVYGNDFNASVYLGRFFRRRCTLQEQSRIDFIKNNFAHLTEVQLESISQKVWPFLDNDIDYLSYLLSVITDIYTLPLRETEQLLDKVKAVLFNTDNKKIDILLLCSLMVIHDKYFDYYQNIMNEKRPKVQNANYFDTAAIRNILHMEDISREVNVHLTPSTSFENGMVEKGNLGYAINLKDGKHSINYAGLLATQLENLHSGKTTNHYNEIVDLISRGNGATPSVTNVVGFELLKLEQSKDYYKNWVELATYFDA